MIQEYYAAEHLLQQLPKLLEDENKFKREYLNYWKWTEAIALMLALPEVTEKQAVKIVELALEVDLMLGARLAGAVVSTYQSFCVALINNVKLSKVTKVFLKKKTHFIEIPDWLRINLLEATQSVEAFPTLRKLLKSLDPLVRASTAYAIGELGDKDAESDLIELQNDPDPPVSKAAKSALRSIKSEEVAPKFFFKEIPKLLDLRNERTQARTTLKENQKEEIQLERDIYLTDLCRHLNSSEAELRCYVVIEIGRQNFNKALPQLLEMVHDSDVRVRRNVVKVLGRLGNASTALKLLELIGDSDSDVVKETCGALGELGNKVATSALIQVLEKHPNFRVRQRAANALGNFLMKERYHV
ncbi:MAG: HEAT repeat domain-containing protein [Leptolyngbyaceae cyanobacterium SL_5_14]|nr:HEAT repeat domain-containing protein [Leptolyngbyaceae cyanobacterium SL_5_14]